MKFTTAAVVALIAGSSAMSFAQGNAPGGGGPQGGGRPDGEGGRRPPPPIIEALDLNHDGVISSDEIAKAAESLKKLDKNGDGQLTRDEIRPPRPDGDRGQRQGKKGEERNSRGDNPPPGKPADQPPARP
jgi:hypothetical protein